MAKVTLNSIGGGVELDSDWLEQLLEPEAYDAWESEETDQWDMTVESWRKVHNFAFSAGVGVAVARSAGVPMNEIVPHYDALSRSCLGQRDAADGIGAMVELWKFGGEFYRESQALGLDWCNHVRLSSHAMGKHHKMHTNNLLKLGIEIVERHSHPKNSLNVA